MEKNESIVLNYENHGSITIQFDEWNSFHFKKNMGNVSLNLFKEVEPDNLLDIMNDVVNKAKEKGFEHLTFKVDTNQKKIIQSLIKKQFLLVDTLISYIYDFKKVKLKDMEHKCSFRDPNDQDIEILKDISKKSFSIDRFHSDPSLDNKLSDEYYEKWIENSYKGLADKIIVPFVDDVPVGYTTGKLPNEGSDIGVLVLSAVSSECRGRGIYTSMIYEGIKWLEGKASFVKVGTQIDNVAVQKTWIKLGFVVYDSQYIFQKNI